LFLLTLCYSLSKQDEEDYLFIAFFCGLFLDFFSTGFFGIFTLSFLIISLILQAAANRLLTFTPGWKVLSLALIFTFVFLDLLTWFFGLITFKLGWSPYYTGLKVFFQSLPAGLLYNLLLVYPIFLVAGFLKKFVDDL